MNGPGKRRIILASASKRRSQILRSCGIKYTAMPGRVQEASGDPGSPRGLVVANAELKAVSVASRMSPRLRGKARRARPGSGSGYVVIGVDTMVLFNGRLIGKPRSARQAKKMLRDFSGRGLSVYTGICVIDTLSGKTAKGSERTGLKIRKIPPGDIERYFRLLGPYDKAGGFSIEGAGSILFDDIRGSYFNVLGLPMGKLQDLFGKIGLDILDFIG